MKVRIAGMVQDSIVDGPGLRMTIFMQGCPHKCCGCHNPHTHDLDGGYVVDADDIIDQINCNPLLDGITFSGGEPLEQGEAIVYIVSKIEVERLTVWCYTGWMWEEIMQDAWKKWVVGWVDVLVDGRFMIDKRTLELKWRGSENQRIINVQGSLSGGKVVLWDERDS